MKGTSALVVIFVLATAWSVTKAYGHNETDTSSAKRYSRAVPGLPSYGRSGAVVAKLTSQFSHTGNNSAPRKDDAYQINQTPANTNASVVPAAQSILALIAVLHQFASDDHSIFVDSPPQFRHHRILFEAIISPNAP